MCQNAAIQWDEDSKKLLGSAASLDCNGVKFVTLPHVTVAASILSYLS